MVWAVVPRDVQKGLLLDATSCLDVRALNTKKKLLRGIFDAHKKDDTVNRGELLVALSENPTILLEAFPRCLGHS